MESCWASPIGGCSDKRSREHYISASLWSGNEIEVIGLPWCRHETKKVGLGSLTAHILCEAHNNALSPLDQAAGHAFGALRRASALANTRGQKPEKRFNRVRFEADGSLLERWFLKTVLNLAALRPSGDRWYLDQQPLDKPGVPLVGAAFGRAAIASPIGLYTAASVGDSLAMSDRFEAAPVSFVDQGVVAFACTFRGIDFLLWLAPDPPPETLAIPWGYRRTLSVKALHRHLRYIRWEHRRSTSHYVQFIWPEYKKAPSWIYRS